MAKRGSWRAKASPIIAQVLKDNEGQPEKVVRKALKDAYPFGERSMHPYKIWLDEIKIQLGKRRFGKGKIADPNNPDQTKLF